MIGPVAGELDDLTEISYRAHWLLDNLDAPRLSREEELHGILDAARRLDRERAEHIRRLEAIEDRLGIRRRPALRLVDDGD